MIQSNMAKIDEIKEILNTLRIALSITIGIIVILVGSIVGRYDNGNVDSIFWSAVVTCFVLIAFVMMIVNKIAKKTKEIKPFYKE
jgi:tyrosine-protein phosphatase YwqE